MENSSTRTPQAFAVKKCPASWIRILRQKRRTPIIIRPIISAALIINPS
jgi:hypothetical protein